MLARERLSWLGSSISLITCAFSPPYRWLQCCRLLRLHRCVLSLSLLTPNQSAVPLKKEESHFNSVHTPNGAAANLTCMFAGFFEAQGVILEQTPS